MRRARRNSRPFGQTVLLISKIKVTPFSHTSLSRSPSGDPRRAKAPADELLPPSFLLYPGDLPDYRWVPASRGRCPFQHLRVIGSTEPPSISSRITCTTSAFANNINLFFVPSER